MYKFQLPFTPERQAASSFPLAYLEKETQGIKKKTNEVSECQMQN
jgi:hypothetical protein